MRNAAPPRPAGVLQHRQGPLVFAQPVGQRAVELQPVAVRAHAAVADQVARILVAEQVLAGRHRPRIELGQRRLQLVVQRIAGFLVPEQRILAQHPGVVDRGCEIEAAVGIDRQSRVVADLLQHRLDAAAILGDASRRRSSSSPRCSRDRDSCASRHTAPHRPCRDSSSRRRHRRRRADRPSIPCRSASRRNSGLPAIFATASHTAMSIVPTATERSPWPPGFSLVIRQAQMRSGSRFSPVSSSSVRGSASSRRGAKRSRISPPWP